MDKARELMDITTRLKEGVQKIDVRWPCVVSCVCFFVFNLLCQKDFSYGKFLFPSPGKASCDRVALPNLRCMVGVSVFP